MARTPIARTAPPDMIRDAAITALGAEAVKDHAITAVVIYERADGVVVIRGHNGSRTAAKGLLREAAAMEGVIDD